MNILQVLVASFFTIFHEKLSVSISEDKGSKLPCNAGIDMYKNLHGNVNYKNGNFMV
jgi:hypothetical protein